MTGCGIHRYTIGRRRPVEGGDSPRQATAVNGHLHNGNAGVGPGDAITNAASWLSRIKVDIKSGKIPEGSKIACTLTGHGLKDPDTAIKQSISPTLIEAKMSAVKDAILSRMSSD